MTGKYFLTAFEYVGKVGLGLKLICIIINKYEAILDLQKPICISNELILSGVRCAKVKSV
jgi:hypothetical protein